MPHARQVLGSAYLAVLLLVCSLHGDEALGIACITELGIATGGLPDANINATSSAVGTQPSDVRYDSAGWCPSEDDSDPCIEFRFDSPKALSTFMFRHKDGGEYMETWDLRTRDPGEEEFRTRLTNALALNATTSLNVTINPPVVVEAFRICPRLSVGKACFRFSLRGCADNNELCPNVTCPINGTCMGPNYCTCPDALYGSDCSINETIDVRTYVSFASSEIVANHVSTSGDRPTNSDPEILVEGFQAMAVRLKEEEIASVYGLTCFSNLQVCSSFTLAIVAAVQFEESNSTFYLLFTNDLDGNQHVQLQVKAGQLNALVITGQYSWNLTIERVLQDVCQMEKDPGPCKTLNPSWYYSSRSRECFEFNYGGCGGNGNRFSSEDECEQTCKESKSFKFISGQWYRFVFSWNSRGGLELYANGRLIGREPFAEIVDYVDPAKERSNVLFGYYYSPTTYIKLEIIEYWPLQYSEVLMIGNFNGYCGVSDCDGIGSIGCYDNTTCICRKGYLGTLCDQTVDSANINIITFSRIESSTLYSSMSEFSVTGDITVETRNTFLQLSFLQLAAGISYVTSTFDTGCIGDLSCENGYTFSVQAQLLPGSVTLLSVSSAETNSSCSLAYDRTDLVAIAIMNNRQYNLSYTYAVVSDTWVSFEVSFSKVFGFSLVIDEDVKASTNMFVEVSRSFETYSLTVGSRSASTALLKVASVSYAAYYRSKLQFSDVSIATPCPMNYCKNGGVCIGVYECACSDGYFGAACDLENKNSVIVKDIALATIKQSGVCALIKGKYTIQNNNALELDSTSERSYVEVDLPSNISCLTRPQRCRNGFTMSLSFSITQMPENSTVILLSTGGDPPSSKDGIRSGVYVAYNIHEQYEVNVRTPRGRWSVKVPKKLSTNKEYNIGFSWSFKELSVFVDNVVIASTTTHEILDRGVVTKDGGNLRIGSGYGDNETSTYILRLFNFKCYSVSRSLLSTLKIVDILDEVEDKAKPCDSDPCDNGECTNKPEDSFECRCFYGYSGDKCGTKIGILINRFSFKSLKRIDDHYSIATSAFALIGRGNIELVKEGSKKIVKMTGSKSSLEISLSRYRSIRSIFTNETVSSSAAFTFSFEMKLIATNISTATRLALFSIGSVTNGDLTSPGLLLYYENGLITCYLSLRQKKYKVQFPFPIEDLAILRSFDLSFSLTAGLVIRTKPTTETTYTVLGSATTSSIQALEEVEIEEAVIGSRGDVDAEYSLCISTFAIADDLPDEITAKSLTLELCSPGFCQNGGICDGSDHCLCDATLDFTGRDCAVSGSSFITEAITFIDNEDGTFSTSSGNNVTIHGSVSVSTTNTSITASSSGSFIEVDSGGTPCLSDPSSCSDGFTICIKTTFIHLVKDSHICLISTGGQVMYGLSLTYDNKEKQFLARVSVSFKTWELESAFEAELNVEYDVCLSWSEFDGISVVTDNEVDVSDVFETPLTQLPGGLGQNLRFGSCYGVVHTDESIYSINSYTYYAASIQSLAAVNITQIKARSSDTAPEVEEVCDVDVFRTSLTSLVKVGFSLFNMAANARTAACTEFTTAIATAQASIAGCWDEKDQSVSSSSLLSFMRYSLRPNALAFKSLKSLMCDDLTVNTDAACDFATISSDIQAFFMSISSSQLTTMSCMSVSNAFLHIKDKLETCSPKTMELLTSVIVQLRTTVSSVCAKSTCNIEYSKSCISEASTVIRSAADDGYTLAVCKKLKQALSCVTNHTIDCNRDTYSRISTSVEEVRKVYFQNCFSKSPKPSDPVDCDSLAVNEVDTMFSFQTLVSSKLFTEERLCSLLTANLKLFTALPTGLTGHRLEKFINARDFLMEQAAPCFADAVAARTAMCSCNITSVQACAQDAQELLDNTTSSCSEIQEAVTYLRLNSDCTGSDEAVVDAAVSRLTDKLNMSSCHNLDPGSICPSPPPCPSNITSVCTDPVCSEAFLQCVDSQSGCGPYQKLFELFQTRFRMDCPRNETTTLAAYNYQHAALETCVAAVDQIRTTDMDDFCSDIIMFKSCLDDNNFDPVFQFYLDSMKVTSRSFIENVCSEDTRLNGTACSKEIDLVVCYKKMFATIFEEDRVPIRGIRTCLERGRNPLSSSCLEDVSCGDDEESNRRFDSAKSSIYQTYRNLCSIATREEVNQGCNVAMATQCINNLATRIFGGDGRLCGTVSSAKDCVLVQTSQCPEAIRRRFHSVVTGLQKLTAKDCCVKAQSKTCDPAGAVTCVLDIHHLAKMPAPDWEGICRKVNSSMECMRSFTDTCEECEKDTVHYIVERLNSDIVDTCRRPPEGTCKVTNAITCVEELKTFAALRDSSEKWEDFTCLKVQQAETCISEYMKECDRDVKFTLEYQMSKVVRFMEAEGCRKVDTTQNCVDILCTRIEDIIGYDPRNANNTRCVIPGMTAPDSLTLEECRVSITCDKGFVARPRAADADHGTVLGFTEWTCVSECSDGAKFKLVEEKGSLESGKGDSKASWQCVDDKHSKESGKNSKETGKNSKEAEKTSHSSKKVLYKTRLENLCAEARVAWSCVEHELKDKTDSRATILFETVSGLWEIAQKMCNAKVEPLRCYTCHNALTNDACNLNIEECGSTQSVCRTIVRFKKSRVIASLTKGCVPEARCTPACIDGDCFYCCTGPLCNVKEEGPIKPICSMSYAARCAFRLAASLSSNKEIQCSVFEAELKCMREVREQCLSDTQSKLFKLTETLYESVSFKKCKVLLAPPTCSVHSVVSLGLLLLAPEASKEDVCRNYDATMLAVTHAKKTTACSGDVMKQVDVAMTFIRAQLRGYGCRGIDGFRPDCDKEKECNIQKVYGCFKDIDQLLETHRGTDQKEECRKYLEIRSCLESSTGCTDRTTITVAKNLREQFKLLTEAVADRCVAEIKAASCDPDDREIKCRPMDAVTKCFNGFTLRSVFSECQNLKLAHSCIMRETANCLPIQRKMSTTLLYLQPDMPAIMARCGNMPDLEVKVTPYTQVLSCMGDFAVSLKKELMSPSESLATVCTASIEVVQRCMARLDLDKLAKLSPLEKLYLRNTYMTLQYLEDAVCEDAEPKPPLSLSETCLSGYENASTCLSVQTIGLMIRPFLPTTDVASFCGNFYEIETCVQTSLDSCTTEERGAVGQYLEVVREKSVSVCISQIRTRQRCSPHIASACLFSLSAYMESGNITLDNQCRMVDAVLDCVNNHIFGCQENTTLNIRRSLKIVVSKYGRACPAEVRSLICHKDSTSTAAKTAPSTTTSTCGLTDTVALAICLAPLPSLEIQSNQFYEIQTCWILDQVYKCVRNLPADCSEAELATAWSAIHDAASTISGIRFPCADDFSVDSIRSTCPLRAPTCSIMGATACLHDARERYTGTQITSIARESASCVWGNVTGCSALQQTIFSLSIINIFDTSLSLTLSDDITIMPFYTLLINFNGNVTRALSKPTYSHLDLCFAAKATLSEFEQVFVSAGTDGLGFEKVLIERGRTMLTRFTSSACNDFDVLDQVLTYEETTYECKRFAYNYSSVLILSIFSGFLSMEDTTALCRATSQMEKATQATAMASCSAGFQQQMVFASRLLKSTVSGVCKMPRVCNLKHARYCISRLSITIAYYGLNTTQEDVCNALQYTDKCVEENTFRCVEVIENSFNAHYAMERSVALDICGGVDESAFIPRCKVKSEEYAGNCSPRKAERCLRSFVRNAVTWPILRRGKQCAEFTKAQHCLQKTAQNCVERGNQLSFNGYMNKMKAFFGENTCNVAEYEQECVEGCELQEAELAIYHLKLKLKSLHGSAACAAISDARLLLMSKSSQCSTVVKLRLKQILDTVLRSHNLHNTDCINVYKCISNFRRVVSNIFGLSSEEPEHGSKQNRKNKETRLETGTNSKETGKEARKGSLEYGTPSENHDLSTLCLEAREAWECVETGFHLVPSEHRRLIKTTLQAVWKIVQHRCANTVRQSCYSCDGALTSDECNTKTMLCGDQEQMCQSIVKIDYDNRIRFYKTCVRPSLCKMMCSGSEDNCRSYCCVGNLCNREYNFETPIEPLTCHVENSVSCALSLVRNIVNFGKVNCSTSRRDLECVGEYTRECRSPTLVSLSSAAFSVMSMISQSTCKVEVASSSCGSKAILSTYTILKTGFATLDDKICRAVNGTILSLQRIEDKGVCTLSELIPVRQSLNLIKQQTAGFCGTGGMSVATCNVGQLTSDSQTAKCGGQYLSAAHCLVQAVRKYTDIGTAFCNTFQSTASCLDKLTGCTIPASISNLNMTLSDMVKTNCTSPSESWDSACPASVCQLTAARACYETSVLTDISSGGSICDNLRVSRRCILSNTSGCLSIQEVVVLQEYKTVAAERGASCQLEELTMKQDIFTDLSTCLMTYVNALTSALSSSDVIGEMCAAHAASKTCTSSSSLPILSSNFTKSAVKTFNEGLGDFLEDKCRSDDSQTVVRKRRGAFFQFSCDVDRAGRCLRSYLLASFVFPTTPLSDRPARCRNMDAMHQCVMESSNSCPTKEAIMSMLSSAKVTFDEYCSPRQYKTGGCDFEMLPKSRSGIDQLATSAVVSTEDMCSNTKNALGWVKKFSSACSDTTILSRLTTYFGGLVGNTCPRLTVELFCGANAPITRSCDFKRAQTCVNNIDLSIEAEADTENFCSGLLRNVTCTRNNLDGCLSSEIAEVSLKATANRDIILSKSCSIDAELLDFGGVCTARPVCSLSGAYRCLEDLLTQNYDLNDCTIRIAKRNCMATHLQGCNQIQISLVTPMFEILLPPSTACSAVILATSPFSSTDSTSQQDKAKCLQTLLSTLAAFTATSPPAPQRALCSIFIDPLYLYCVDDVIKGFVDTNCTDVVKCPAEERFCSDGSCYHFSGRCNGTAECSDGSDEVDCGVAIDAACQIREGSFCVMKQLSSAIMTKYLTVGDKRAMCSQREKTSQCIQARTNTCPGTVKAVFQQMLVVSEAFIKSQGTCTLPRMCIEEQTFACINQLAVVVAQTDITTGTKDVLCNQFHKTKSCVEQFSATCTSAMMRRIRSKYNSVVALIDGQCDNYTEPGEEPEMLCPDIAPEDRKCEVFTAFNCLLGSYTNLINNNPRNNLENSKSCFALQSTIRCVAANISGCKEEDAAEVIKSLNNLRDSVKDRCMLYDTSLCGNPQPCPVGGAGCVKTFQKELSSHPEKDVCELITTARTCISHNTVDCSPQAYAIADYSLKKAIKDMKTQVRCDGNSADSCVLTFQTQANRILSHNETTTPTMSLADQCSAVEVTRLCINDKRSTTRVGEGMEALVSRLWRNLNATVVEVCEGTAPTCPLRDQANVLLSLLVKLATNPSYTKQAFCSEVPLMLGRVSPADLESCGTNNSLSMVLQYLQDSYTAKCQTTVTCEQAKTDAKKCIDELSLASFCGDVKRVQACLGKAIGQCSNTQSLMPFFKFKIVIRIRETCTRLPVISHSLSTDNTIYLAEGGPPVKLTLRTIDFTDALTPPYGEVRLKISFDSATPSIPRCPNNNAIQQVASDKCQIVFNASNNGDEQSFELSAVLDNTVDGYQQVKATITMERWEGSPLQETASETLGPFTIQVQDRDGKSAICSSINDPHLRTFDGRMYNYMGTGTFIMYENRPDSESRGSSPIKLQVQTKFQTCGLSGSCNCAVYILVDNDVIVFDICGSSGGFTPLKVDIKIRGDMSDAVKIMMSADHKTYQVVMATGQIVKVRASNGHLNAWILASASDRDNTRGLCGMFDGDRYNDLTQPDGSLYQITDADMVYGTLTPDNYTLQWRVVAGSEDDISNGVQGDVNDTILPNTCQCGSTGTCDQFARSETCGLIRTGAIDITSQLVIKSLQAEPIFAKRRRKRQAETEPETFVDSPQPGWPTSTGWTEQNATDFCQQKITDALLNQKCSEAAEVTNNTADIEQTIRNCVDDIRMTGMTDFADEANEDLKETCISGIDKDLIFQTDTQAREIAAEIMNLACTPVDCNGKGRCEEGICVCNSGYIGTDCSINKQHLPAPILHGLEHFGLCEFSDTQACTDIFVSGRNFVESELLKCHIEIVEINENGFTRVPGNMAIMTSARLVTETTVHCTISAVRGANLAALVAISNDGVAQSQKEVFIAYDPTCQQCDHIARKCYHQDNTCNIAGQCYTADAVSADNTCVSCQPMVSKTQWTTINGKVCKTEAPLIDGSSILGLKQTIGIGVACAVVLFILLAVIVKLACMRRSRAEQKRHERYTQQQEMNVAALIGRVDIHLSSFHGEPQDSFCGRKIHPRINTTGHDSFPDMH